MKLNENFHELLFKNSKYPDECVLHSPKYPRWTVVAIKNSYPPLKPRRGGRVICHHLVAIDNLIKMVVNLVVYSQLKGII